MKKKSTVLPFVGMLVLLFGLIRLVPIWLGWDMNDLMLAFGQQLAYLWAPGLVAGIIILFVKKERLQEYGLIRKYMDKKWFWAAVALPYLWVVGTLGLIFLFGNLMGIPGFGEIIFTNGSSLSDIPLFHKLGSLFTLWIEQVGVFDTPPMIGTMLIMSVVFGVMFGSSIGILFTLGEELGWRGLMVIENRQLGWAKSSMMIGALSSLVQLPIIMTVELDYPWTEISLFVLFNMALSFILIYINDKANSILPSAAFKCVLSFAGFGFLVFIVGGDERVGSLYGISGIAVLAFIIGLIYMVDKAYVRDYADMRFATYPTEEEE